jgi:hypothetical protein
MVIIMIFNLVSAVLLLSVSALSLPTTKDLPRFERCILKSDLVYPISDPKYRYLHKDKPRVGENNDRLSSQCDFMSELILGENLSKALLSIEKHDAQCVGSECKVECDRDCDNRLITELYESYLIKFALESENLTSRILRLYKKVFKMFESDELRKTFETWVKEEPLFPVNQKDRDWSLYNKDAILEHLTGISHDPTSTLLSADFLKQLQYSLTDEFKSVRDYMFNHVLKKMRGYRTNSKKGREGKVEANIGITSFDFDDLKLDPTYYPLQKWPHPGRSMCDTEPVQGMYQTEAVQKFVPIKCGISGSTNFWIWTALFSGVNMTQEEVRLYILSAFIVLGADGGHSLMEVLSSATMSAIFMKNYEKYSPYSTLTKYLRQSNFADNLYEVTKDINPIGNRPFACIDFDRIANHIYSGDRYESFNDKKNPPTTEIDHRKELESFFLMENNRFVQPFADYASFLDKIPSLNKLRKKVILKLNKYARDYCSND